jgi:hypothetical protein
LLAVKKVVSKWVVKTEEILEDVMTVVETVVVVDKVVTAEVDKVVEALTAVAVEAEDKVVARARVEEDSNKFNFRIIKLA